MSDKGPPLGARKSVDICLYLFQTLQIEARKLSKQEADTVLDALVQRYSLPYELARELVLFLRRP